MQIPVAHGARRQRRCLRVAYAVGDRVSYGVRRRATFDGKRIWISETRHMLIESMTRHRVLGIDCETREPVSVGRTRVSEINKVMLSSF